jgi:hypothetical protein
MQIQQDFCRVVILVLPSTPSASRLSEKIQGPPFSGKLQSQRNVCQGNGRSVFRIIPLTNIPLAPHRFLPSSILHPPSSLWLRSAALGFLRLFAAISSYSILRTPLDVRGAATYSRCGCRRVFAPRASHRGAASASPPRTTSASVLGSGTAFGEKAMSSNSNMLG